GCSRTRSRATGPSSPAGPRRGCGLCWTGSWRTSPRRAAAPRRASTSRRSRNGCGRSTGWPGCARCAASGAARRPPHHQGVAAAAPAWTLAAAQGADLPVPVGGEDAPLGGGHRLQGVADPAQLVLQRGHLVLQLEDALDPGEVDAVLLGERLDLAKARDVAG